MYLDNVALDSRSAFAINMGSLTPAATAASTSVDQDFDVPAGTPALKTTDQVHVSAPASSTAVRCVGAHVKDANTISFSFTNPTASSATHTAGTFGVLIVRV